MICDVCHRDGVCSGGYIPFFPKKKVRFYLKCIIHKYQKKKKNQFWRDKDSEFEIHFC